MLVTIQVHNIMDQGYECTECGNKSRHCSHLKDHINAMPIEAKFKCDLRDYEAKYKNRIKSHRVAVHKIVGLPCTSCNYVASEPWVLSQHVKHTHIAQEVVSLNKILLWVSFWLLTYWSRMKDFSGTEEEMQF